MDSLRKWLNKPKADDKSLLARFYHADRALSQVANELDSFDGRSEPERCSRLVSKLRQEQDRVLGIINQIMDELLCDDRACRAFRAKFPEEVLQESLAGQLWFGAECLSAGSAILNREVESAEMRPLAKAVTKSLDNVRNLLRDQCLRNNTPNSPHLKLDINDASTETLYESLKIFDRLFAEFELLYVSAMVQVKTKQEHEIQQLICVLFSETLQRALKLGILDQEQVDTYDPSLMFSIPRLAIISGLIIFEKGPLNMDQNNDQLSEMFRPFRKLLIKMRDYLRTLNKNELFQLEKLLCTNEEINLTQTTKADEGTSQCCIDKSKQDSATAATTQAATAATTMTTTVVEAETNSNNVTTPVSSTNKKKSSSSSSSETNAINKSNENFYTIKDESSNAKADDWVSEEADDEAEEEENSGSSEANLVTADCATGYLVPNTTLGNLLQSNAAPLTYNIVISESGEGDAVVEESEEQTSLAEGSNRDSGIGSGENGGASLDQSPEQEQSSSVLTGQYDENWENLRKIVEPAATSSSKGGASGSSHHRHKEKSSKRKSRKHHSSSSDDTLTSTSASSSASSSPTSSESRDISRRAKFKSTENLLHRLFVCIAGVADQLQTNFAADLRQILKAVFLINCTQEEDEKPALINVKKSKDNPQDLFEFRASEENVIRQSNSNQGSIGSQQSICSAEEVNPESDDAVFEEEEEAEEEEEEVEAEEEIEDDNDVGGHNVIRKARDDNEINRRSNKRPYGNRLTGRSISLSDETTTTTSASQDSQSPRRILSSSPSTSHHHHHHRHHQPIQRTESPPKWIPDSAASKCMACDSPFTAFRRRHHCRCCGQVFCGVCSSATTPLPRFGLTKPVRVCRVCYGREATA